jgi:hypothetical protein
MRRSTLLLALGGAAILAVLPLRGRITPLFAQGTSGTADTTARRPSSPIGRLIAHRQRLDLTDAQVSRLTQIEQQLEARNRVLRDSIRTTLGLPPGTRPAPREMTSEQRQAWRAKMRALEPVRKQMRDNMRSAMEQVRATLTADQRAQVHRAMRRMRWRARAFAYRRGWGRPGWGRGPAWGPGPGGPGGRGWRRGPDGHRGWRGDSTRTPAADSARAPAPPAP